MLQHRSRLQFLFLSFIIIGFVVSCGPEERHEAVEERSMFSEISKMYKQIDPSQIDYLFNKKRGSMMLEQMNQMQYPEKMNLQLLYIKELLRSNRIEEALKNVNQINQALIDLKLNLPTAIKEKYLILQATIYLRQGELQNCIENHQATSCIIPFTDDAIHVDKKGSEAAIPLLNDVLAINPENYSAIWLLNIAYETLGQAKKEIDNKFRIDFKTTDDRNVWPNKSGVLGIDFNGLAGGVISDDFNNDGTIDIIISSWGEGDALKYYENNGSNAFIDKSEIAGLNRVFGGLNINHTDYNNDGFLDVFVMRGGWFETQGKLPNSLLRNNGDGTFTDITSEAGIYTLAPSQSSSWMDVNQDGWIDLFVANESSERAKFKNELWINNQDGTFTNRIQESGITAEGFFKGSTAICLTENSTRADLFLSDYKGDNKLYRNSSSGNQIQFEEVGDMYRIQDPKASFSCWSFDYNNDGLEDLFVSAYGDSNGTISPISSAGANYKGKDVGATPIIYKNTKNSVERIDQKMGLDKAAYTMGSNFGDLDNDGFLDFYLSTGDPAISSIVPNLIYRNNKAKNFDDVSFDLGMAHLQKGHGVAFADFDRDGDQDIYTVLGGAYEGDGFQNAYFENPGNDKNWIVLKLEGTKSNKAAIGARVHLKVRNAQGKEKAIYRKVTGGSSFGANSFQLEIGLDDGITIVSCDVIWPFEKSRDSYHNLEINSAYYLIEGAKSKDWNYQRIHFNEKVSHEHQH